MRRTKKPVDVESITHVSDTRRNIPTEELRDFVAEDEHNPPNRLYPRNPDLDPQLVWQGKDEQDRADLEVPVVPIYIQEKIHPHAMIEDIRRQAKQSAQKKGETTLDLFADFNGIDFEQQLEFYQHNQKWQNRMILGDSLFVMTSLAEKEGLKGQVQMIYLDPPYGIKFGSNWQVSTRKRDVKDGKAEDLTRQPEQVKAFRDTWKIGIHSYLAYLRDRLVAARELLTDSGSVFVQIGDENVHLVRCLLDEVFGAENFCSAIAVEKTGGKSSGLLDSIYDTLLWYAKDREYVKYRPLFEDRQDSDTLKRYVNLELPNGEDIKLTKEQIDSLSPIPDGKRWGDYPLHSQGETTSKTSNEFYFRGKAFLPKRGRHWTTSPEGLERLYKVGRIVQMNTEPRYKRYADDFPVINLNNIWTGTMIGVIPIYVVQTATKVIERCLLMTTDPGDLVLDPTCVRKGTRIFTPPAPPQAGGSGIPPACGGTKGGSSACGGAGGVKLAAIETLVPGDYVLSHDEQPHRITRVIQRHYRGKMIGIRHRFTSETLWVTADHPILILTRQKPHSDFRWDAVPKSGWTKARLLRKAMTPPEQKLWEALHNAQMGLKFRRQHPIGPYIADFYCKAAAFVVEVDGEAAHGSPGAHQYDTDRDRQFQMVGLDVLRIPAQEVLHNLEGVYEAIHARCVQRIQAAEKTWITAEHLHKGDVVFYGEHLTPVQIDDLLTEETDEQVYDLEVENAHSFITEVCAVHNCGSGTTAYVAEQWGRRWITVDTSRVALALARTRLMAAKYPYYLLADSPEGLKKEAELTGKAPEHLHTNGDVKKGFVYKRVPHITLKSIANNVEIDVIHAQYQEQLEPLRAKLNELLHQSWEEWDIPRHANDDWSRETRETLAKWWELRQKRQAEIDAAIARNADTETLFDQPVEDNKKIRVTGPFTVESLSPHRVLSTDIDQPHSEQAENAGGDFTALLLENLRKAGVQNTIKNERLKFDRLDPYSGRWIQAEGRYTEQDGAARRAAISIGPEHGAVSPQQVKEACKEAVQGLGFDVLLICGLAFDPHVSEEARRYGTLIVLPVRVNPDLVMGGDLLKKTGSGNLFMIFGEPDLDIRTTRDGKVQVELKGLDIYDPTTGQIRSNSTREIACWFIDTNYNEESFFVRHAYFTGGDEPYDKLKRALKAEIDEAAWSQLYSTVSRPFDAPESGKIAVKVINHYGDEVLKVFTI